ncbi:MAG: BspA family leucine-rich repeat surface protein, partial [Flavobacteriaceae bacterium]
MKKVYRLFSLILLVSCSSDDGGDPVNIPNTPDPVPQYTLSVVAGDGGTVSTSGGSYNEGTSISVTANPNPEYVFVDWSNGSTDNPISVTMNENISITANFVKRKYPLQINTEGSGFVQEEIISSGKSTPTEYNSGTVVQLTASPNSGSLFTLWKGIPTEAEEDVVDVNPVELEVNQSLNVTATFQRIILINQVPDAVVGKWKIRRGNRRPAADKSQFQEECDLSELIFRSDGSFTAISATTTISGQFSFSASTTIQLNFQQTEYGTLTNIVVTDGYFSFSLQLTNGCSEEASSDRDETYVEEEDPIDSTPPSISITGSPTVIIQVGDSYTDAGATASDDIDGDLTDSITVSGTVDTATAGTYYITYRVTDTAGNLATAQRRVIVSEAADIIPPVISLQGSPTLTLIQGESFTDPGATATDETDGDLTASITVSGTVDVDTVGSYTITYTVSDAAGNEAFATRTVVVEPLPDTTAPVITLQGSSTILLQLGETFADPAASATDETDGDLTNSITSSGTVDVNTPGTYTITYRVSDAAGNQATATRTVIVQEAVFFENGICKCPDGTLGAFVTIEGTEYTVVDNSTIADQIAAGNINLCTSLVTNMDRLFQYNESFNSSINFWDVSQVTTMRNMFEGATSYNQALDNWDVSNVADMNSMFWSAPAFNQDLNDWDTSSVTDMGGMFEAATNFNGAIFNWDTSNVASLSGMFTNATSFNGDISGWDTSEVTDMNGVFRGATSFNQNIGTWDTSSVTEMTAMFLDATSFNQDISNWCVSTITSEPSDFATNSALSDAYKPNWGECPVVSTAISFDNNTCSCPDGIVGQIQVIDGVTYTIVDNNTIANEIADGNINLCTTLVTNMEGLFDGNATFNEDVSFWDTSNVTNMRNMFKNAEIFDHDISIWDVSSVTNMSHMFNGAAAFNQDLNTWETGSVTNLSAMFWDATNFNGEINAWDTSNVTDMSSMFSCLNNQDCQFNQSLNAWDTSSVVDMTDMFIDAVNFNGNISNWDTSSVTSMRRMFSDAFDFNQDIGNWDTSSVVNMYAMFWEAETFNQYIGGWDTSSATDMEGMFRYATVFNQDISNWCVSNITSEPPNFAE